MPTAAEELLSRSKVCRLLSVSEPTLKRLLDREGFPQPAYRLSERGSRWRWTEIIAWLESRRTSAPATMEIAGDGNAA